MHGMRHVTHSEQDKLMIRKRLLGTAGYTREDAAKVNAMTIGQLLAADKTLAAYRKARRENEE